MLKSNFLAIIVEKFIAYNAPAIPANAADMINAVSLYLVIPIPTDSAAILLSLIAVTARPVLLLTRFRTTNNAKIISRTPAVNDEISAIPTAPCGPFIIVMPSSAIPIA